MVKSFLLWLKLMVVLMVTKMRDMSKHPSLNGELNVTGEGFIDLELGRHQPKEVVVCFTDYMHVPCNPGGHDDLKYHVKNMRYFLRTHHDCYILRVSWSVSSSRMIKWQVSR